MRCNKALLAFLGVLIVVASIGFVSYYGDLDVVSSFSGMSIYDTAGKGYVKCNLKNEYVAGFETAQAYKWSNVLKEISEMRCVSAYKENYYEVDERVATSRKRLVVRCPEGKAMNGYQWGSPLAGVKEIYCNTYDGDLSDENVVSDLQCNGGDVAIGFEYTIIGERAVIPSGLICAG